MSESIKIPESLADFPRLNKIIDQFKRGERESKAGERKIPLRSEKLETAIEQFPDLAPVIEFLLDPKNSEEDRISKVEELNTKSKDFKADFFNTVSFESGSGGNITLRYINNGKFEIIYTRRD